MPVLRHGGIQRDVLRGYLLRGLAGDVGRDAAGDKPLGQPGRLAVHGQDAGDVRDPLYHLQEADKAIAASCAAKISALIAKYC